MTAACGFGYQGRCCCECALHLLAEPKCHHLGGDGKCGDSEGGKEQEVSYVCLAFAAESGIAITNWMEHGCCEVWTPKKEKK